MERTTTTRRVFLEATVVALTLVLSGCKAKKVAPPVSAEKQVMLVVRAVANSNSSRPLQIVVRETSRKSFVEDDYSAIARLVVVPDETVIHRLVVFPGQVAVIPLKFDKKYPEALGIYGLFNLGKGESWKTFAERPLEIEVVAGESAFERPRVRERDEVPES